MTPPDLEFAINGRFLAQKLSGVQRYAREIVRALDRLIVADPAGLGRNRWRLIVPADAADDLRLDAIERHVAGTRSGHAWEQINLPRAARGMRLLNLGNSGPLLHRQSTVVIHDAAPFRTPKNFSPRYAAFHRMLGRLLARTSRLGTVSEFSRRELADVLHVPAARIFIANNGCDHLVGRPRSAEIVPRLALDRGRYFLFVGSPTLNKNLAVAVEAFRRLNRSDARFVVAGSLAKGAFGDAAPDAIAGVTVAGGLSDAEIAGLYADAAALVFPTRYEGFGIPPLEAMTCGCPVIASDIPVLHEVCADAARYFDPDDADALARLMAAHLDRPQDARAPAAAVAARVAHFTWERAARSLSQTLLAKP